MPLLASHTAQLQVSIWPTLEEVEGVTVGMAVDRACAGVDFRAVGVVLFFPLFPAPLVGAYDVGVA